MGIARLLPRRRCVAQEALLHRHSPAQRHGLAALGARAQQHAPGHPHPLQADGGYNALWVPGTDHSGIAVHVILERQLAEEGKTRQDIGREAFLEMAWKWKEESGGNIIRQLKRLGASCDWSRERFTMDAGLARAVRESFVRLYEEGLIYQDDYIVNWCPRCQTVLSDLEVEREDRTASLFTSSTPADPWTVRPRPRSGTPRSRSTRRTSASPVRGQTPRSRPSRAPSPQGDRRRSGRPEVRRASSRSPRPRSVDFEIGRRHNLPTRTVIGLMGG